MDKVLEFVSPNKSKWKVLTDQESDLHRNTPTHDKTLLSTDRQGRKADQSKKHAHEKSSEMLKMHRLLLNCDNHAQKGVMQQNHEHSWETC